MKKIFTIFALLFGINSNASNIHISTYTVGGVWSTAIADTYYVENNILIDPYLFIEPGVCVYFNGNYRMLGSGAIIAEGTSDSVVTFTGNTIIGWDGIDVTDFGYFNFCDISYCKLNPFDAAIIDVYNNSIEIKNSKFHNCSGIDSMVNKVLLNIRTTDHSLIYNCDFYDNNIGSCLSVAGDTLSNKITIDSCNFYSNRGLRIINIMHNFNIKNCVLHNNDVGEAVLLLSNYRDGIDIDTVLNNKIYSNNINQNGAIKIHQDVSTHTSPRIYVDRNFISNNNCLATLSCDVNGGSAFHITSSDHTGQIILTNNIITHNISPAIVGGAIFVNNSNVIISNNTIINNYGQHGAALRIVNTDSSYHNILWAFNNIFSNNRDSSIVHSPSIPIDGESNGMVVIFNNYFDSTILPYTALFPLYSVSGNIQHNVLNLTRISDTSGIIANPLIYDYTPLYNSICIDSGNMRAPLPRDTTYDYYGRNRINNFKVDIGAIEYLYEPLIVNEVYNNCLIYPNPANNVLHIELDKYSMVVIYDIMGRRILSTEGKNIDLDVSSLSGIYFLLENMKIHKIEIK